ncbi:TIGR03621 family F420-dependent LLM class oxidoreductase [Amycolatopsis sp. CA-230715]|uniref:TIGR03621 family F420-dependent LLM class oxidoreductase n=1 Tax=Amycolatopsis sp. CA-230715 TaxID=2745196 RepID=UPI001C02C2A4|nr:TIGR03621 family F420-dependent LLM class oxidoreductase [Amycolatopsis sp. CA-230715]
MATGEFRFGVNMTASSGRQAWVDKCRRAEELGFDVVAVPDHLGMVSPFPALVLAAEATERVRVGTFVINAPFFNPTLLARDIVGTDLCTDGRLEIGLGAGYVKAEFDKAGLPFESPGKRVDHLERTIDELARFAADETEPNPAQNPIPLLVAGNGNRVLELAAERADIIGFAGAGIGRDGTPTVSTAEDLDERVAYVRGALDGRQVEFNTLVQRMRITEDRESALDELVDLFGGTKTRTEIDALPTFYVGTADEIADKLRANRERFGFTYVTVLEPDLDALGQVIPLLR